MVALISSTSPLYLRHPKEWTVTNDSLVDHRMDSQDIKPGLPDCESDVLTIALSGTLYVDIQLIGSHGRTEIDISHCLCYKIISF